MATAPFEHPPGLWLSRNENPVQMVSVGEGKKPSLVIMQVCKNNPASCLCFHPPSHSVWGDSGEELMDSGLAVQLLPIAHLECWALSRRICSLCVIRDLQGPCAVHA